MTSVDAGEAWLRAGLEADASAPRDPLAEAVRLLGGDDQELLAARRRIGHRDRHTLTTLTAAELLPDPEEFERKQDRWRRYYATDWRWTMLRRCRNRRVQFAMVEFLEANLKGTETDIPDPVQAHVEKLVEFDATQQHVWVPGVSARKLYEAYAAEVRKRKETEQ